jgi:hypothetical protein
MKSASLVFLIAAVILSACANNVRKEMRNLNAAYNTAAGPDISMFSDPRGLYSWQALGDSSLAVYTQPKKAYLLDVSFCPDLKYAGAIALTSRLGWVTSGMDQVKPAYSHAACLITRIRPVDLAKLQAAELAQRKAGMGGE